MEEFKDRLRILMDERGIKTPEELAYKLKDFDRENDLHANTIRNYLNGKSPKDVGKYKILATFFNVSTDYLQGFSIVKTNNIDIKNFCNEYGLSEKSLKALKRINNLKKDFKDTMIDTVNKLLEDIEERKADSLFVLIDDYFTLNVKNNYEIAITEKGDVFVWDKNKSNQTMGKTTIDNETLIISILLRIQAELIEMKKKESENNEHKRTRKK